MVFLSGLFHRQANSPRSLHKKFLWNETLTPVASLYMSSCLFLWSWLSVPLFQAQLTSVSLRSIQTSKPWLSLQSCSAMERRMNLCSVTGRCAERLPLGLTAADVIISPPSFSNLFLTRKLNHSQPLLLQHNWGTNQSAKGLPATPPPRTVLGQFFKLCGSFSLPLAQPCVWETFALTAHFMACVYCVCLCEHVRSHPRAQSCWVPPLTNWLVNRDLFIWLEVSHVSPPGMQAWAS